MKRTLLLSALLSACLMAEDVTTESAEPAPAVQEPAPAAVAAPKPSEEPKACPYVMEKMDKPEKQLIPENYKKIRINVIGQGVAPSMTTSPAQAYALAKRAAIADAYRLLAEKVKGVRIEGSDKIKNMMVQRSEIRTFVDAVIAEAEVIETVFKDGLCEVEMELSIDPAQWRSILASR